MPPTATAAPTAARGSFWQRRIAGPIRAQLTQGVSPDRIASTLAIGTACSLFPFLGFTSLLNLGVGLALRMNQPILQTLNQLLGPLQLVLIIPSVRLGEAIWRAEEGQLTITELLRVFREASFLEFMARFGWAGIHALTAWLLTAPLLAALVLFTTRPIIRAAAGRLRDASAARART
jgi:uncharacterized protein (DUF2062 family)